jgi:hypothetical protein
MLLRIKVPDEFDNPKLTIALLRLEEIKFSIPCGD